MINIITSKFNWKLVIAIGMSILLCISLVPYKAFASIDTNSISQTDNKWSTMNNLSAEEIKSIGQNKQEKDDQALKSEINKSIESSKNDITRAKDSNNTPKFGINAENSLSINSITGELPKISNDIQKILPAGQYYISASFSPGKVLDVSGGSYENGANVQIYQNNSTNAQKWTLAYDDKGYATFKNGSGKYLDVSCGEAKSGQNVWQYSSNGSNAQKWIITKTGSTYKIESALSQSLQQKLVLDVLGGNGDNGTNVQIYYDNGTSAQRFTFNSLANQKIEGEKIIEDGEYAIAVQSAQNKVIDISGGSKANGANAQIYDDNNSPAQTFHFTYDNSSKCYVIHCVGSGKVLDVSGGSVMPTANVWQYEYNGTDAQKWAITKHTDGSLKIQSRLSGNCLDLVGGSTNNGTNVNIYYSNETNAQKFIVKERALFNEGIIEINSLVSDNSNLDVPGGAFDTGTQLQIWSSNSSIAQKFSCKFVASEPDYICTFRSVASGLLLADNGGKLVQTNTTNTNSQWKLAWTGLGISMTNVQTGQAMDVSGGISTEGTKVITYKPNSSKAQSFSWNFTDLIQSGQTYEVMPECNINNRLNLDGWNWNLGANIHMWPGTNDLSKWRIESVGGGNYRFVNPVTEYVMDVANGSTAECANVQQYSWNGSGAQLWQPRFTDDGWFYFVNVNSGKALDVAGASGAAGANVDIYSINYSSAQKWHLRTINGFSFSGDGELDNIIRDVCRSHPTMESCFYYIASFNYYSGSKYPSGEWSIPFAKEMYYNHGGNCYRFAALFKWCVRGFGYGSEAISGHCPGWYGLAPHGWTEVYINGGVYVCDPDMQHEMPGYNWYMCTYDTAPMDYYK